MGYLDQNYSKSRSPKTYQIQVKDNRFVHRSEKPIMPNYLYPRHILRLLDDEPSFLAPCRQLLSFFPSQFFDQTGWDHDRPSKVFLPLYPSGLLLLEPHATHRVWLGAQNKQSIPNKEKYLSDEADQERITCKRFSVLHHEVPWLTSAPYLAESLLGIIALLESWWSSPVESLH
jgi:hypothetical protein